ncbi:restriction endonuclease subunit S [Paenibacillus chartarius]|uniref:Restriction endonuclease subunit S n=1 Tax=Paenibacillus chartarius TaxID=747481 RepID=A0ABV6DJG1_9BACL
MSKKNVKSPEEVLKEAFVPVEEQPYKVPDNWVWVRLGFYLENYDNLRVPISTDERRDRQGPFPYYGASGVIDYIDGFTHEGEFILLGEDGANLVTRTKPIAFLAKGKIWVNNHAHVLRTRGEFPNKFVEYYLNSISLNKYVSGSAQPKLNQKNMNAIPLPIPPLNEQKRIADKLESLLDKINQAKQLIEEAKETFELRRAAILEKAFRGELTRNWRVENVQSGSVETLLQKIIALRNDKKSKTIGKEITSAPFELPYGWKWIRLEDLIEVSTYGTSAKTNDDVGVPVLRMGNIHDGQLILDNLKYLPIDHADVEKYKLEEYDLLFNRTNSYELVGKTAVVRGKQATKMTYASYLVNVRLFFKEKIARYICYYINSHLGRNYLLSMVTQQVGQANINASKLASLIVPMPPEEEIAEITRLLDNYIDNERSIFETLKIDDLLNSLEKAILAKAYSGDLGTYDEIEASPIALIKDLLSNSHK